MFSLALEPTNLCNLSCRHCVRDKLEPRQSISLELAEKILSQAKSLGIKKISLTGGEVAIYPHLEELLRMIADFGFDFTLVTNGFNFGEKLLPLLRQPKIREKMKGVGFSLDGARAESHDALRGRGSFKQVVAAITLCQLKGIPIAIKSFISNFNKNELQEIALLGAALGAKDHYFIYPFLTPTLIKEGIIPPPRELERLVFWVIGSLAKTVKTKIYIEGYLSSEALFTCCPFSSTNVDYQGNLIFCCNLSHVCGGDKPATAGQEFLANLKEESLKEGIIRHFRLLAKFMEARLRDWENLPGLTRIPCIWCYQYFGKLDWLKNYPDSPWAEQILFQNNP